MHRDSHCTEETVKGRDTQRKRAAWLRDKEKQDGDRFANT